MALMGRSKGSKTWYGAVELKWLGRSFDRDQMRLDALQDVMRLTFVTTNLVNARLLVMGGPDDSLRLLFDAPHPGSPASEGRRVALNKLLAREAEPNKRVLTYPEWSKHFPAAGDRVPALVFADYSGPVKCQLLAVCHARVADDPVGSVYVWQCSRN